MTRNNLLARYVAYVDDLAAQGAECAATGILPDIARTAVALYGSQDTAAALHRHFGMDVVATQGSVQ